MHLFFESNKIPSFVPNFDSLFRYCSMIDNYVVNISCSESRFIFSPFVSLFAREQGDDGETNRLHKRGIITDSTCSR